jgi:hypothetical protein
MVNKTTTASKLSVEKEKEAWRKHHIASLLEWADLPLTKKIEMLEDMEKVARSIHGGKLPPSPDEHEERSTL